MKDNRLQNKPRAGFRVKFQFVVIAIAMLFMALSAHKGHAGENQDLNGQVQKEWTFLLFLNGHNNLDSFGRLNMNGMEQVGSSSQVNLVVQWASLDNGPTQRILVQKDQDLQNVTSPIVESMPAVDMGDYRELVKFVEWGVKRYPAKKYFIAVWNHGSGWHRTLRGFERDISYDDLTQNHITTEQLGLAMKEAQQITGQKIELYGSDACLMAMVEVAGEMKDSVKYFAGSQDLEPGEGWPYAPFIQRWVNRPTINGAELGKILTEEYVKAYSPGGVYHQSSVTFSIFDLSKYDQLSKGLQKITAQIPKMNASEAALLKTSAENAFAFYYDDYRDLSSLLSQIRGNALSSKTEMQAGLSETEAAAHQFVLANGATDSFSGGATGLSVWLPMNQYDLSAYQQRYSQLQFNRDTQWLQLIQAVNP